MATIHDAQQAAYRLANPQTPYNEETAIAKKWLVLKAQGVFIGVPIGPEMDLSGDPGGRRAGQAFTSGVVLVWYGGNDVRIE